MRLVLDITVRPDGRYLGHVTPTEAGTRHEFGGVLELLAILEQHLQPDSPGGGPGSHPDG
jgi:hypothetical protein